MRLVELLLKNAELIEIREVLIIEVDNKIKTLVRQILTRKNKRFLIIVMFMGILSFLLFTPTGAIKRHLFLSNPIKSLTCSVKTYGYVDPKYGQLYTVEYFVFTGPRFVYLKRNSIGCYYWFAAGSGP